MKPKKCKVCTGEYEPRSRWQKACSPVCAMALAHLKRMEAERKEAIKRTKEAKEKLKTRSDWMKEAQQAFNGYIRARDAEAPCISCGRYHDGQYHAGHYLSVGARPELRFCEINVWKQCAPCNNHLSGNAILYRKGLIKRIGLESVEWLEGPHEPKRYTIDDLKRIKALYKNKLRICQAFNDSRRAVQS